MLAGPGRRRLIRLAADPKPGLRPQAPSDQTAGNRSGRLERFFLAEFHWPGWAWPRHDPRSAVNKGAGSLRGNPWGLRRRVVNPYPQASHGTSGGENFAPERWGGGGGHQPSLCRVRRRELDLRVSRRPGSGPRPNFTERPGDDQTEASDAHFNSWPAGGGWLKSSADIYFAILGGEKWGSGTPTVAEARARSIWRSGGCAIWVVPGHRGFGRGTAGRIFRAARWQPSKLGGIGRDTPRGFFDARQQQPWRATCGPRRQAAIAALLFSAARRRADFPVLNSTGFSICFRRGRSRAARRGRAPASTTAWAGAIISAEPGHRRLLLGRDLGEEKAALLELEMRAWGKVPGPAAAGARASVRSGSPPCQKRAHPMANLGRGRGSRQLIFHATQLGVRLAEVQGLGLVVDCW